MVQKMNECLTISGDAVAGGDAEVDTVRGGTTSPERVR